MDRIKTKINDDEYKIVITNKASEKLKSYGLTNEYIINEISSHIEDVVSSDDNEFMIIGEKVAFTGLINNNEIIIDTVIDNKFVF